MNTLEFFKFLHYNRLVDFNRISEDCEEGFDNRLRIQKFVNLAQNCFSMDLGYEFNLYRYGPYSPDLADYYFSIQPNSIYNNADNYSLPDSFDQNRFLNIFHDKNNSWLEMVTTIIDSAKYNYKSAEELLDIVNRIKPKYEYQFIKKCYNDTINYNLIKNQ